MKKSIYSTKYRILLAWLKEQRKARKLSMRALADKMYRPHSFISKTEQGERRLDLVEYIEYCNALNIDPVKGIELIKISRKT